MEMNEEQVLYIDSLKQELEKETTLRRDAELYIERLHEKLDEKEKEYKELCECFSKWMRLPWWRRILTKITSV